MKKIILLFCLTTLSCFSQIKGKILDEKGNPLPFVNVYVENTYNGTTSNENGDFELLAKFIGKYSIIFQNLGYKTKKETVTIEKFPFEMNIRLQNENFKLNEITIDRKNNPAIQLIKNAIASRNANSVKNGRFTADFYSRAIFKVKDLPKKIMGIKVDIGAQMESNLDSTGSGIIYLSETVSKITSEKPNKLKERIIASKISGNDKGFSYNSARNSDYDFYENSVNFNIGIISPIANNALNYYKYKIESSFFDENKQLINKVKVTPKRDKEPVFEGYIYIVEDSWAIYAVDLEIKGYRMKNEFTEIMTVKQNFNFNSETKIWSKNSQSLVFRAGAFGIKFDGKFNYVFSNYEFKDFFDAKTFGKEILSFEDNSNKKDNNFWNGIRPIPLTSEESNDYKKKDSLQIIRLSPKYLDSIDKKHNKFSLFDIITGYNYRNSYKKYSFNYDGLLDISSLNFNTVQGYSVGTGFSYKKWNENRGKNTNIKTEINYGFSEKQIRISGEYLHRFNNQNYANITLSGGTKVAQFNSSPPITNLINSVSSLYFKNNFMKLYNLEFAKIAYGQEVGNGIFMNGKIEYQQRKPLFNTTDHAQINNGNQYTANNPLAPNDFVNAGFDVHRVFKFSLNAQINFGNRYLTRPDGKFNIPNKKYPTVTIGVEQNFAASEKKYEFTHFFGNLKYELKLENKGEIAFNIKAGTFLNAKNIAFMDYKHFNGNQTHIGQSNRYLNVFNFLPYYTNSTNDSYLEIHSEYDDNGFVMNKIPLLNKLKSNLILGAHGLMLPNAKPYREFTVGLDNLGFGKFKLFRVDYIRSYQNGYQSNGLIFGCKILNVLE